MEALVAENLGPHHPFLHHHPIHYISWIESDIVMSSSIGAVMYVCGVYEMDWRALRKDRYAPSTRTNTHKQNVSVLKGI